MNKNFENYLNEIGEIPHNHEFDFENDKIVWRYLDSAEVVETATGSYERYGTGNYGEVLVNGKVIGYFHIHRNRDMTKKQEEENWFWNKHYIEPITDKSKKHNQIRRIWGKTHYIWDTVKK